MRELRVIWRSAGLIAATTIDDVVEVVPPVAWRAAPGTPPWVRGLFSYRGQLVPLVDVARLLGAAPEPDRMVNRVIVIRVPRGDTAVEWHVGLWVETVLELDRIDFEAQGGHPGFATEAGRFLGPIAQTQWGQVQLIKPRELFTPDEIAVLTDRMCEGAA